MLDIAIVILLGAIYGFIKPGKEDRVNLFKKGLIFGLIIGVIIGVVSALVTSPLGFLLSGVAFVGTGIAVVLTVVILAFFFTIGTFVGDTLESIFRR